MAYFATHPPAPGASPRPNGMYDAPKGSTSSSQEDTGRQGGRSTQANAPTDPWRVNIEFGDKQAVRVRVNGKLWVPGRIVNQRSRPRCEWQQVEYEVEYQWGGGWRVGLFAAEDLQRRGT